MFLFGNKEDIARMFLEEAGQVTGPPLPSGPLDELTEQELRHLLVYCRIAIKNAKKQYGSESVVDFMVEEYDRVFSRLAEVSETFRNAVDSGKHQVIGGYTRKNLNKYRALAGLPLIAKDVIIQSREEEPLVTTTTSAN